jgi:hypothetical protein
VSGRRIWKRIAIAPTVIVPLAFLLVGCGEQGLLPTTVDPGPDFVVADVVFDDQFFYCRVEPLIFQHRCGPGVSGQDPASGCHFNVTSYRLTDYTPLVAERMPGCNGDVLAAGQSATQQAQQNYQTSQARMKRDPELAQLLLRPTGQAKHPRTVVDINTPEGAAYDQAVRQWATQFSSQ